MWRLFLVIAVILAQSQSTPWYGNWFGFRVSAPCEDSDIDLQIALNDATRTCQETVQSAISAGFDCDTPITDLGFSNSGTLRTYCCQTCPTRQPSSAPTKFGTCSDNDNLLKKAMGYFQATCASMYAFYVESGRNPDCSTRQAWGGSLDEYCCSTCNDGETCVDNNVGLVPYLGPALATCSTLAAGGLCKDPLTDSDTDTTVIEDLCPVSCGLCPGSGQTTAPIEEQDICDLFTTGSGQKCTDIEFPDTMCRVLVNFHTNTPNCNRFCSLHGTNCVGAWTPLRQNTCHGGSWISRDCDYNSEQHICDCQDASITFEPTFQPSPSHPTTGPLTTEPTKFPTLIPTATKPSSTPITSAPTTNPTDSPREIIEQLKDTIHRQIEELKNLNIQMAAAQDVCMQRYNDIEAQMQC